MCPLGWEGPRPGLPLQGGVNTVVPENWKAGTVVPVAGNVAALA